MGFTIEDMTTVSRDKYGMEMIAGKNGWSNSISWILLIEDMTILHNFKGKDLAVTTGLGFPDEEKQLELVKRLVSLRASGLIINTGKYIMEIPESVIACCDENDLPLLTVPWSTQLFDLIKDLNMRVLLQGMADEQISAALIRAIEAPGAVSRYRNELLPYFDVDGSFQVVLLDTGDLDRMDTVERSRIEFRLAIYLENISHNASFFYYDACFVLILNAIPAEEVRRILGGFMERIHRRMQDKPLAVGVGSPMRDIENLHLGYARAKAAVNMARQQAKDIVWFDDMGIYRMLSLIPDQALCREMGEDLLRPVLDYDKKHETDYLEVLEAYLKSGGSVQAVSEQLFAHRNTVIYRMNNIRKMLNCSLEDEEERLRYLVACLLFKMQEPSEKQ